MSAKARAKKFANLRKTWDWLNNRLYRWTELRIEEKKEFWLVQSNDCFLHRFEADSLSARIRASAQAKRAAGRLACRSSLEPEWDGVLHTRQEWINLEHLEDGRAPILPRMRSLRDGKTRYISFNSLKVNNRSQYEVGIRYLLATNCERESQWPLACRLVLSWRPSCVCGRGPRQPVRHRQPLLQQDFQRGK